MKRLAILTALFAVVIAPVAARAQVPQLISYQGVLTDGAGNLVPDGPKDITFRFFSVAVGGAILHEETHLGVPVSKGGFSVLIGSVVGDPLVLPFTIPYWLEIQVAPDALPLTPRIQLASSPYTQMAETVLDGAISSAKIATGGVASVDILDNTIVAVDIAPDAVGASEIATGGVGSAEILDNSIASADVLNNSLDTVDIADEPGIASVGTTLDNAMTNVAENLVSRIISLPQAGYVIALGSANIQLIHTSGTPSEASLSISLASATHNATNVRNIRLSNLFTDTGTYRQALSSQEAFFFGAAGPQTIYLVGSAPAGAGISSIETSLLLMYFPTAYGTVTEPQLITSTGHPLVIDR